MPNGWLLAAALMLGQAGAEAPVELAQTVNTLVRELDSPQRSARDAAEQKLLELGVPALAVLPEITPQTTAETKQRLERVKAVLERARAEAFLQGTKVTLAGEHKLSEILAELQRQTGNKILDYRAEFGQDADDPTLKVGFDKTPFWQAFDSVLDDAGLTLYPYADQSGLALVGGGAQRPRAQSGVYVGAFRFEPVQLTAKRDLRGVDAGLGLQLEIAWEPRLAPLALQQPLAEISAAGDDGRAMPLVGADGELEAPLDRGATAVELLIPFELPPRSIKKIVSVKGTLKALIPGALEKFHFTHLQQARQVEQRRAGLAVTLEEVRKNNAVWEVRVRFRFERRAGSLESHRNWLASCEVYLTGDDGQPIRPDTMETTVSNEEVIGLALLFDRPQGLEGLTLVCQAPGVIVTLPVAYELKDLELP